MIGILITAAFFLKLIKDVFLGEFNAKWEGVLSDMTPREIFATAPLLLLTFLIGVYPRAALRLMDVTMNDLIRRVLGG